MRRVSVYAALLLLFVGVAQLHADETKVKNVIVMIADGSGFNALEATRMWRGEGFIYDADDWDKYAMTTYSFARNNKATEQDAERVYDPVKSWDVRPVEGEKRGYPYCFEGYKWHMNNYPDSAATMSQMMTGQRMYNGSINTLPDGTPAVSVPEMAKKAGKKVGSISTVFMSDATPAAGGGAHHEYRGYQDVIANEMFDAGICDVIGGAGNPDYNNNGDRVRPMTEGDYKFVGGQKTWEMLKRDVHPKGWKLIEDKEEIEKLASGELVLNGKVVMVPKVRGTLQQGRKSEGNPRETAPGDDVLNDNVPTLAAMTQASLNLLGKDKNGFFLQVEGGAVDKAMHANQTGRMIEEYDDFHDAVKVVSDYLDANTEGNNWSNTMVIVTADHDHLIMGPEADKIPFQPLEDRGKGKVPGNKWFYNSHSNMPVPFFVKGQGAELFEKLPKQLDKYEVEGRTLGRGAYFHQIDMGQTLLGVYQKQIDAKKAEATN
ncbi:alkaline phosphatase [Planctomycetota bacterium]|nr:alkaline phosphatase [Planctomycetota bacterium]